MIIHLRQLCNSLNPMIIGIIANKAVGCTATATPAKTQDNTTGTSDKKDAGSTTDTIKNEDKTAVSESIGTVPQPQTQTENKEEIK